MDLEEGIIREFVLLFLSLFFCLFCFLFFCFFCLEEGCETILVMA